MQACSLSTNCNHALLWLIWRHVPALLPGAGGSNTVYTADQLRGQTIPELIDVLKARGLSTSRGKKEELMQRVLEAQERAKRR